MQGRVLESLKRGVILIQDENQNIYVDYQVKLLFGICQLSCSNMLYLTYRPFFDRYFGKYKYEFDVTI